LTAIGDVERFQCGKQIASYLGLVPLEKSSGNRRRLGHITKQGSSMVRFLLVEAAQVTVRIVPEWRSKTALASDTSHSPRSNPLAGLSTRQFSAAFPLHGTMGSWDHECFLARRQDRAFPLCTRFPVLLRTKDPPFDRFDRFSGEIRQAGQRFCFPRFVAGTNFRL